MLKIVLTLALIFAVEGARVTFKACPNGYPTPEWVESDFCTDTKCTLTRGQTFTSRVSFTPREQFGSLIVGMKATLLGLPFPVDIPAGYENACNFLEGGASCPVQANTNYIWAMQAPIASSYPAASGVQIQSKKTSLSLLEFLFKHIFLLQFKQVKEPG
jgi:ML domain